MSTETAVIERLRSSGRWKNACKVLALSAGAERLSHSEPRKVPPRYPTDGTRMVAALAARDAARPVNRKRVQAADGRAPPAGARPLRATPAPAGLLPGHPPDELWHLDMTSVWVAETAGATQNAAIDCCTREICAGR